jgi:hypothetical protein
MGLLSPGSGFRGEKSSGWRWRRRGDRGERLVHGGRRVLARKGQGWAFYLALGAEIEPDQHFPPPHGFMRAPWRGDFPPDKVI